jgi:FKBP12-rapamycin complex-associated protein
LLNWRLTSAASPTGPNFNSEREQDITGSEALRARRPSILDRDAPPSEFFAAQLANGEGIAGAPPGNRSRARTNSSVAAPGSMANGANPTKDPAEMQNARAVEVLDRVAQKLTGRDFKPEEELDVINQVNKLINEATKLENLCQHYIGWCSFW